MLTYSNIYFYFQCFESRPTALTVITGCQSCFAHRIFSEAGPSDVKLSCTTFGRG